MSKTRQISPHLCERDEENEADRECRWRREAVEAVENRPRESADSFTVHDVVLEEEGK